MIFVASGTHPGAGSQCTHGLRGPRESIRRFACGMAFGRAAHDRRDACKVHEQRVTNRDDPGCRSPDRVLGAPIRLLYTAPDAVLMPSVLIVVH